MRVKELAKTVSSDTDKYSVAKLHHRIRARGAARECRGPFNCPQLPDIFDPWRLPEMVLVLVWTMNSRATLVPRQRAPRELPVQVPIPIPTAPR